MHVLAIDLGTSGPKVGLVDRMGEVLGYEFEATSVTFQPGGGAEERPAVWWESIDRCVCRLLQRRLAPPATLRAIVCTGQWSGTVAVDRAGKPLMNAINWMDSRGAKYIAETFGGFPQIEGYQVAKLYRWIRRTGGVPSMSGKDPIAHILLIREEYPEVYEKTYRFLEPKDYLNGCLTGNFAASYDSIALHWVTDNREVEKVRYDPRLLDLVGIDPAKLPPLKRSTDILAPLKDELAERWGLPPNLPVVMGTPDVHSATLGSGAIPDFVTHLYIGTSSWITCHVPFKKTDIFHNIGSLPGAIPGRYMLTNAQESAGSCLSYARGLFFENPDVPYHRLDKLAAQSPPGSRGVLFTPWLYGERAPVSDPTLRGGFHNLSLDNGRADLVRSVFEGVAFNSKWLFEAIETFVGRKIDSLLMVGGGAVSDFWCQIYADILEREIRQVADPIVVNLRGAAFLAWVALGMLTFEEAADLVPIRKTFSPIDANGPRYRKLYSEFVRFYRQTRSIYSRLNRGQETGPQTSLERSDA